MNAVLKRLGLALCLIVASFPISAQEGPRGHWSGVVEVPDHPLNMELDLDKTGSGWIGSISMPAQNVTGLPLEPIAFTNGKWVFRIKGGPGNPTFTATLAAEGKTLTGDFTQGTGSFPFKFSRTGEPKVEIPKSSPALTDQFLGTWEGTLQANQSLRIVLKMFNDATGSRATMISLDQGGVEIPVTSLDQKEAKLLLDVKMVGGQYEAEINKEGSELNGTWTQGGSSLPLKLKKAGMPAK